MSNLPAISGNKLIKLLIKDNWVLKRKANHGASLYKVFKDGKKRVTIIPTKNDSLPTRTLFAILNDKQTGLGKRGFLKLLEKK